MPEPSLLTLHETKSKCMYRYPPKNELIKYIQTLREAMVRHLEAPADSEDGLMSCGKEYETIAAARDVKNSQNSETHCRLLQTRVRLKLVGVQRQGFRCK